MRNIESNVEMGGIEMEDENENHETNNGDLEMGDGQMEDETGGDNSEAVDNVEMTKVGVDVEMAEVQVGVN